MQFLESLDMILTRDGSFSYIVHLLTTNICEVFFIYLDSVINSTTMIQNGAS